MNVTPLRDKLHAIRQQAAGTPRESEACIYLDIAAMALDAAANNMSSALIKEIRYAIKDAVACIDTTTDDPLEALRDK